MLLTENSLVKGVYENLSDNLSCLRRLNNLSQERLSQMINVSRKQYCKCEKGAAIPSLITICHIAEFYQIRLDALIVENFSRDTLALFREKAKEHARDENDCL